MSMLPGNNDEFATDEIGGEREVPNASGMGKRRTEDARSSLPPKPRKKMAKRSDVWKHFIQNEDDAAIGTCRYCAVEIGCDTKTNGTGAMKNHIARCKLFMAHQESGSQTALGGDSSGNLKAIKYDPNLFRRSVNQMVVLNELPFSFVESEGFRRFCHNVVPMYTVMSRRTATRDIAAMFEQEKASLKTLFSAEKKRVSLTTDLWVAPTTSYNYMVVTAHWIDANWEFQKRIISFKPITDHKGHTIARHLLDCLEEWGIEKVFTVTVDNAKANDKALSVFQDAMILKGVYSLVKGGEYLHMRCCAHILNLVVKDGMDEAKESIVAVRNAVKYVRSSFTRLKSFEMRVETGRVSRGSLSLDCATRWNSTYLMLTAALKLRVAFEKLLEEDKLYSDYFEEVEKETGKKRVGPPTSISWDEIERLVKFLKIFFNATLAFSASKSVSSSTCYNEIVTIERNLISLSGHADEEVRRQARAMRYKFEKYWDGLLNMNPLVIVASVFDPRKKMQFASLCFDKLYGKESIESKHLRTSIKDVMRLLYEEYVTMLSLPSNSQEIPTTNVDGEPELSSAAVFDLAEEDDDGYERMDVLYSRMVIETGNTEVSSELDIYLMEKVEPPVQNSLGLDYDVLDWWKRNSVKYPFLSELARDVLAIQVSSVASESAFSTSGRILDPYRSCLTPYMIEALICTQQWLRTSIQQSGAQLANLVQMFEELDFHESLDSRIPPHA